MRRVALPTAIVALLLCGAARVPAQSLADLARQEEERRKAIQTPGKVYTNDSLRPEPPSSAPAAAPVPLGQPPQPPAAPGTPAVPGQVPAAGSSPEGQPPAAQAPAPAPQTEAEWRKRIAAARDALSRAQVFAEALQSRINALSTDFVNTDDPVQRDMVAAERQKALAELDRVKQDIQQQQKTITGIQDEARRAGVPAGWVR